MSSFERVFLTPATRRQRLLGAVILGTLGVGSLALQARLLLRTADSGLTTRVGLGIPVLLAFVLLVAAVSLPRQETGQFVPMIALWSLGGATVLAATEQIVVLYHRLLGIPTVAPGFFLSYFTTVGAVTGLFVGVYDARLRVTKTDLDEERDRARELSERLAVLNRVLRHDLRSGVQSIRGYARMLPDPDGFSSEDTIQRILNRTVDMHETAESARDVQELISAEEGAVRTVDLHSVVTDVTETTEQRYPAATLDTDVPSGLSVQAHFALGTALEELIENGIYHNDGADPRVTVSCVEDEGGVVELRVRDNGPGIPEPELDALRGGAEGPLEHASGVGLWVVKWIVDGSDGDLSFETSPDGTTAVIELRRAEDGEESARR